MKKFISTFTAMVMVLFTTLIFASCGGGFKIETRVNNASYGTVTQGGRFEENTEVTLTATAKTGYRLHNWTLNGNEYSKNDTITIVASKENEGIYVANFEQNLLKVSKVIITSETDCSNDVEIKNYSILSAGDSVFSSADLNVSLTDVNVKLNDFYVQDFVLSEKLKVFDNNKVRLNISLSLTMQTITDSYSDYSQSNTYTITKDATGIYVSQVLFEKDSKGTTNYGNVTIKIFFANAR